ncbi:MAG: hypothetical protein AB7J30_13005 [Hyphomicrobium sp.]|uniref:hypothetical protein n=1 Tax=Hyphomicrobium sp. TaxID=82 RepID=UPI003D0DC8BE
MSNALSLIPPIYGEHFAGVWLLDRDWAAKNGATPVALVFYSRAYYKKFGLLEAEDGSFMTGIAEFTYVVDEDRVMSFSMDEPLADSDEPITDEEMAEAASEWKFDGKDLWIREGEWLQFHPSSLAELLDVGFDKEALDYWALVIRASDPAFKETVTELPVPGNVEEN